MDSKDELEKLLQNSILDVYKELQIVFMDNENIKTIFNNVDSLIEKISKIKELESKMDLYEDVINLLCLIYSQNKTVVDKLKHSIYEIDVYKLKIIKLKIDQVVYYDENKSGISKPIKTSDYIANSKALFSIGNVTDFDYTLLISNGIVKREPGQHIIDFKLKNTRCVEYNIRNLVDKEFVDANFKYTTKHGINKNMVKRYETITMYDSPATATTTKSNTKNKVDSGSTPMLNVSDISKYEKLYQVIDDENVRELVPIKFYQLNPSDPLQLPAYNEINLIEQIVTHIESFEISLLRTNEYVKAKKHNNQFSSKAGVIDTYLKNNTIEDSIWKALSPSKSPNTDSSLRLASSIYAYTFDVLKTGIGKRFIHDKNYINKLNDIRI